MIDDQLEKRAQDIEAIKSLTELMRFARDGYCEKSIIEFAETKILELIKGL